MSDEKWAEKLNTKPGSKTRSTMSKGKRKPARMSTKPIAINVNGLMDFTGRASTAHNVLGAAQNPADPARHIVLS